MLLLESGRHIGAGLRGVPTQCQYKARSWRRHQIGLVLLGEGSTTLS